MVCSAISVTIDVLEVELELELELVVGVGVIEVVTTMTAEDETICVTLEITVTWRTPIRIRLSTANTAQWKNYTHIPCLHRHTQIYSIHLLFCCRRVCYLQHM